MKISMRLALVDVLGIVAFWAIVTAVTGSWDAQHTSALSFVVLLAATLVVFWRVGRAYISGPIAPSRAIAEGFVCGAAFAVAVQVLYWAALLLASGYATAGSVTNFAGVVNLLQQASFAGAAGAVMGFALWAVNRAVLRSAVL